MFSIHKASLIKNAMVYLYCYVTVFLTLQSHLCLPIVHSADVLVQPAYLPEETEYNTHLISFLFANGIRSQQIWLPWPPQGPSTLSHEASRTCRKCYDSLKCPGRAPVHFDVAHPCLMTKLSPPAAITGKGCPPRLLGWMFTLVGKKKQFKKQAKAMKPKPTNQPKLN